MKNDGWSFEKPVLTTCQKALMEAVVMALEARGVTSYGHWNHEFVGSDREYQVRLPLGSVVVDEERPTWERAHEIAIAFQEGWRGGELAAIQRRESLDAGSGPGLIEANQGRLAAATRRRAPGKANDVPSTSPASGGVCPAAPAENNLTGEPAACAGRGPAVDP